MAEDVMVKFSDDKLATQFLTKEEIQKVCPLAYAEAPTNKVSDKYVLANTGTVIEDMEKLGWKVVSAKQRKAKTDKQSRFSFHMITFQNPDVKILGQDQDGNETVEGYPRIILTNSADGFNSFRFMVGCFRLVCSNNLIIATDKFADMSIRHVNYNFEDLRTLITKSLEALPGEIEYVNKAKAQTLTDEQKINLAKDMFKIRKGLKPEDTLEVEEDAVTEMLSPNREADKGNNLWCVWNTLQEKMIRGGFSTLNKKGKARKARPVKGFIRDMQLNEQFFKVLLNYLNKIEAMKEKPETIDVETEVLA